VSFFGGIAAVFGVSRLSHRYDIIRAGVLVGLVNLLVLTGLDVMQGAEFLQAPVWQSLVFAFFDGLGAAVFTMGSIPFWKGLLGLLPR